MKEKDCGLEIKEVERKFDMCLDVSRSISISFSSFNFHFSVFYSFLYKDRIVSEYFRFSFISYHGIKADELRIIFEKCTLRSIYFSPHCV